MITKTDLQNSLIAFKNNLSLSSSSDSELEDRVSLLERAVFKRYGVLIDQSNSDPDASVTYLYDAVGMTPASLTADDTFDYGDWQDFVYDICKPVMLNPDGTVKYELDRDDQTKKTDGTASEISDSTQTANAMVQFKKWYVSVTMPDTDKIRIVFCDFPLDETYNAYAFTNQYGKIQDVVYYSMFNCSNFNNVARSLVTNKFNLNGSSGETMRGLCQANGSGWDFPSFSLRNYINMLHILISKSLDTQGKFGEGSTADGYPQLPGTLKIFGGFTGKKTVDNVSVKTFWLENLWGDRNIWHNGLLEHNVISGGSQYPYYFVKHTPPYNNNSLEGYTQGTEKAILYSGFIKKMTVMNGLILPSSSSGGSSSTYWCDNGWKGYDSGVNVRTARFGGKNGLGSRCGVFATMVNSDLSNSEGNACRLSFLNNAQE